MGERKRRLIIALASKEHVLYTARHFGLSKPDLDNFVSRNGAEIVKAVLKRVNKND